jgi:hypothetical protein
VSNNNFLANLVDLKPVGASSRPVRRWLNELNGVAYSGPHRMKVGFCLTRQTGRAHE